MAQPSIHSSGSSKPETLLRVEDLVKSYPAFELRNVSFSVEAGTITGLHRTKRRGEIDHLEMS